MANTDRISALKTDWLRSDGLPEATYPTLDINIGKSINNKLTRGSLIELTGTRSCGKTSTCLHILARATTLGEFCAWIDINDSFDPVSAVGAGIHLDRLLWIRSRKNAEHAIRSTDLLLHAGGFGVVLLDLFEASARMLNQIPVSYWYRFRRAIEHTPTMLLICAESAQAKASASNSLQFKTKAFSWSGEGPFARLRGIETMAEKRKVPAIRPEPLIIQTVAS